MTAQLALPCMPPEPGRPEPEPPVDLAAAARNCPRCPECSVKAGTTGEDVDAEAPRPGRLRCACCGHEWEATPAELEQALAADRAWTLVQAREERMASADA